MRHSGWEPGLEVEIWEPPAGRSGDHSDTKIGKSPGKVMSSEKSSSSRTEPWKVTVLEGQQRERTLQKKKKKKRKRRKGNRGHQGRVVSQRLGKKVPEGLVVSGDSISGR